MKKGTTKWLLVLIGAVVALVVVYRAVNVAPSADLPANEQMVKILTDGGCLACHSENPDLPFYAQIPVVKDLIGKHVEDGYASFDIAPFMDAMEQGTVPNEVDLE